MGQARMDSVQTDVTLTAYDFAMEEVTDASSRLAHALLARSLDRADPVTTEEECSNARSVYDRMILLYTKVRLDAAQHASLLNEMGRLRSQLEKCTSDAPKSVPTRR